MTTIRKISLLSITIVCALVLAGAPTGTSQEGDAGTAGTSAGGAQDGTDGSEQSLDLRVQVLTLGGYEAKGVGLRNLGAGTISLNEIPAGAVVLQAHLYWELMDHSESPSFAEAKFAGADVTGELIGSGGGLCWSASRTFSYHADVTTLVTGAGDYDVEVASGLTNGADPWGRGTPQVMPLAEGASLVVIYLSLTGEPVTVQLMDGFISSQAGAMAVQFPVAPATELGRIGTPTLTVLGGDGQTTGGEDLVFNGAAIGLNTFDGSDPQSNAGYLYGNLWDTDTFDVSAHLNPNGANEVKVEVRGDCIGLSAAVLATPLV